MDFKVQRIQPRGAPARARRVFRGGGAPSGAERSGSAAMTPGACGIPNEPKNASLLIKGGLRREPRRQARQLSLFRIRRRAGGGQRLGARRAEILNERNRADATIGSIEASGGPSAGRTWGSGGLAPRAGRDGLRRLVGRHADSALGFFGAPKRKPAQEETNTPEHPRTCPAPGPRRPPLLAQRRRLSRRGPCPLALSPG